MCRLSFLEHEYRVYLVAGDPNSDKVALEEIDIDLPESPKSNTSLPILPKVKKILTKRGPDGYFCILGKLHGQSSNIIITPKTRTSMLIYT